MYLESTSLTVDVQFWVQSQNMDFNFFILSYIIIQDSLCMLISITTLLFTLKRLFSQTFSFQTFTQDECASGSKILRKQLKDEEARENPLEHPKILMFPWFSSLVLPSFPIA